MSMTQGKRGVALASPAMGDEEWYAVRDPIYSGWVTQGPKVVELERLFAAQHAVTHAVAVNNCTAALHLALLALGVGKGDEVIVPSFTWVSTANAAIYCGAKPVFVDIDLTFNIDPTKIGAVITDKTKALIAVHLFGLCADMDAIRATLPAHVAVVEDAACAAGARYKFHAAGSLGEVAAFSFHPRKSITTGEGGMLTTPNADIADRLRVLRNHGMSPVPSGSAPSVMSEVDVVGYNYRLSDIQAAIGVAQIKKLDGFISERASWAAFYRAELGSLDWLRLPEEPAGGIHAWQSYVVWLDPNSAPITRDRLMSALAEEGVATRPGTYAVHALDYCRRLYGCRPEDLPVSLDAAQNSISIPLHNKMVAEDYNYVVDAIRRVSRV